MIPEITRTYRFPQPNDKCIEHDEHSKYLRIRSPGIAVQHIHADDIPFLIDVLREIQERVHDHDRNAAGDPAGRDE